MDAMMTNNSAFSPAEVRTAYAKLTPVPKEGREGINRILDTGEIFRYSGDPQMSEASLLEAELAAYLEMPHVLVANSCTSAVELVLEALEVDESSVVLLPAFTFTAMPSAIRNCGAKVVLVNVTPDFKIDIDHLRFRARTSHARAFLLSHMRGYISDLDAIRNICDEYGIHVIEDAAHAFAARWRGTPVGGFFDISCISFQSYKALNAGEGGGVATRHKELFTRMVIRHGAYENLGKFHSGIDEDLFDEEKETTAIHNWRYNNLLAEIARLHLKTVDRRAATYRTIHSRLVARLAASSNEMVFAQADTREERFPDSFQVRLPDFSPLQMERFVANARAAGLPLSRIDRKNARHPLNWRFLPRGSFDGLEPTLEILETLCDMRLPHSLSDEMIDHTAEVILDAARRARAT